MTGAGFAAFMAKLAITPPPRYPSVGSDAWRPLWHWLGRLHAQLAKSGVLDAIAAEQAGPIAEEIAQARSAEAVEAERTRLQEAAGSILYLETPFADPDLEMVRTKVNELLTHVKTA